VVQVGPDGTNEDVTAKVSKGHFVTFFFIFRRKLSRENFLIFLNFRF
jgi:hypothetical protein